MINPLRGMKDLAGSDAAKFNYFLEVASSVAKRYGYSYLETPILEDTALFKRSVGESSDIVNKEMYQFTDKGGNDVCMRPEGTAGVVRYFVSNKLDRAGGKYRYYYHGPMFRYERPQKGRLREFHQFGCESFGEASVYEDYMTIELIATIFDRLNIGYTLEINSLGCSECMPGYKESLINYLESKKERLCEDCNRRIDTNPIRVLDCKVQSCKDELGDAPKITDNLCEICNKDFAKLKELLEQNGIKYSVNKNLVRGLDYYSKTAFEFVSSEIGAQNAIAGGGRYDRLVEFLDGKPTPAVGFAIGIERVMDLVTLEDDTKEGYYIGAMDEVALGRVVGVAKELKAFDKAVVEYTPRKLKAHLKAADRVDARYCVVIGENELQNGTLWIKDLVEKQEETITLEELLKRNKQ
jgi:histidyl-tRNA synthetase